VRLNIDSVGNIIENITELPKLAENRQQVYIKKERKG
jgi:hypothetical protein